MRIRVFSLGRRTAEDECDSVGGSAGEGTQGFGDVADAGATKEGQAEIAQSGHGLRGGAGPDLGGTLAHRYVTDTVQAVLDAPVAADHPQVVVGVGPIGWQATDAKRHFLRDLAGVRVDPTAHQPPELVDMGPGLAVGPQFPHLSVPRRVGERPEFAPLEAPVAGLGRRLHRRRQRRPALAPRSLFPQRPGGV